MDILIIAEKREQGEKIAVGMGIKVVKSPYINGTYEGKSVCVAWASGHLLEPVAPEVAKPDANWINPESLLPLPPPGKVVVSGRGKKLIGGLLKEICKAKEIWIATDPDREGEAIGRNIIAYAKYKGPLKRLWLTGALEPVGIQKAISKLRNASETMKFWRSQQARMGSDWLWQFLVRAYTMKGRAGLMGPYLGKGSGPASVVSVGRVQTATLKMVVDRDFKIANFREINHYTVSPLAGGFQWAYVIPKEVAPGHGRDFDDDGKVYFIDEQQVNEFAGRLKGATILVEEVEKSTRVSNPPLPHSLTSLQRYMSKKHRLSSSKTLEMTDEIRLAGYLTYPRTEHGELPMEMYNMDDIKAQLAACAVVDGLAEASSNLLDYHPLDKAPACYTTKPMEHHGIVPTGKVPDFSDKAVWTKQKIAIFEACAKSFVVALHPPATFNVLKVSGTSQEQGLADDKPTIFKRKFEQLTNVGWLSIAGQKIPSMDALPEVQKGAALAVSNVAVTAKKTTPPEPFEESTLVGAMLNAGRSAEEGDDAKILSSVSGIGTPATRGAVLDILVAREYVEKIKETIRSTEKGRSLIKNIPERLANVSVTAALERDLLEIDKSGSDAEAIEKRNDFVFHQVESLTGLIVDVIDEMNKAGVKLEASGGGGNGLPSEKMIALANSLGASLGIDTTEAVASYAACKAFIEKHKGAKSATGAPSKPTEKMVNFAKALAKQNEVALPENIAESSEVCRKFIDQYAKKKAE